MKFEETIICPECGRMQKAFVDYNKTYMGDPFNKICVKCGYGITGDDWYEIEPRDHARNVIARLKRITKGRHWRIIVTYFELGESANYIRYNYTPAKHRYLFDDDDLPF